MKQFKGTPGKWRIDTWVDHKNIRHRYIVPTNARERCARTVAALPRNAPYEIKEEELESNANLIATAPELLEAFQNALKMFYSIGRTDEADIVVNLKQVINKALGE